MIGHSFNSADAHKEIDRLIDDDTEEGEDHDYLKAANVKVELNDSRELRIEKKTLTKANSQSSLKPVIPSINIEI